MTNIGLIVTLNKYTTYFESILKTFTSTDLEELKKNMIDFLCSHTNSLTIDYPMELEDFEYIWFKEQYMKCNLFTYKVFMDGKWTQPWEDQDIYDIMLEEMHKQEIEKGVDPELYNEPDPDEDASDKIKYDDKIINELTEIADDPNKDFKKLEEMFKTIVNNSKQSSSVENTIEMKETKVRFTEPNQNSRFFMDKQIKNDINNYHDNCDCNDCK